MILIGFTPKQYRALLIIALLAGHASYAKRVKTRRWPTKTFKFHSPQEVQKNSGMVETNKEVMEDEASAEDPQKESTMIEGKKEVMEEMAAEDLQKGSTVIKAKKEVMEEMAAKDPQKESTMTEAKKEVMEEMPAEDVQGDSAIVEETKKEVMEDATAAPLRSATTKHADSREMMPFGLLQGRVVSQGFSSSSIGLKCCCKLTDEECSNWKGDDGTPAVFRKAIEGWSHGCCSRHNRCTISFWSDWLERSDTFCSYDEQHDWDRFLSKITNNACRKQLSEYPSVIEGQCIKFKYHGRSVKERDCHRFAQQTMDALFMAPDRRDICEDLTTFLAWDGNITRFGPSLLLWCGVGEEHQTIEVLMNWTEKLQSHTDWQTHLGRALRDQRLNNLNKCSPETLKQHWTVHSTCLLSQPARSDMLHLAVGRKLCDERSGQEVQADVKCFEQTFMSNDELEAAARSGNFYAVQTWALSNNGVSCKTLMPVILKRIEKADRAAKHKWSSVKYMACAEVNGQPTVYNNNKRPVGNCFPMPFGIGPSIEARIWCKNRRELGFVLTDEDIREAVTLGGNFSEWDVSKVTDMSELFAFKHHFNEDINAWNTAQVTSMESMFHKARIFNSALNGWNTGRVTSMVKMFYSCSYFNQDINGWNTGSVTSMHTMFFLATKFDQDLNGWNTGSVTNMKNVFYFADSFNRPLDKWNTAQVSDMRGMFAGEPPRVRNVFVGVANPFNQDINSWNTGQVTDMNQMFESANNFNQPLNGWNTGSVKDMSWMFHSANHFNQPLNGWNTGSVTGMAKMFSDAGNFNQPLSGWNTERVTNMSRMFDGGLARSSFNQPLNTWNTAQVNDMTWMSQKAFFFAAAPSCLEYNQGCMGEKRHRLGQHLKAKFERMRRK